MHKRSSLGSEEAVGEGLPCEAGVSEGPPQKAGVAIMARHVSDTYLLFFTGCIKHILPTFSQGKK